MTDPIKDYYDRSGRKPALGSCPDARDLLRVASLGADETLRDIVIQHCLACDPCTEKLALMKRQESQPFAEGAPGREAVSKTKRALESRRAAAKGEGAGKGRPLWLALFVVFMALSFVWREYFLQMLVLAVVSAGKWLLEGRRYRISIGVDGKSPSESGRLDRRLKQPQDPQ